MMSVSSRMAGLEEINKKAEMLDWMIIWDNGYYIVNTDPENKGSIVYSSLSFKNIKKLINNTLELIEDAKNRHAYIDERAA